MRSPLGFMLCQRLMYLMALGVRDILPQIVALHLHMMQQRQHIPRADCAPMSKDKDKCKECKRQLVIFRVVHKVEFRYIFI